MRRLTALALCLLATLCACSSQEGGEEVPQTWPVYFISATLDTAALDTEERTLPEGVGQVDGLLRLLLAGPQSLELVSPIPVGTRLLGWSREEGGMLKVDLSEQYGGLAGVALTQADYAITLTLCQLPDVEAVAITVEGEEIAFRDHQILRPSDVILSGGEDATAYITATLFFPLREGGLKAERRDLLVTENDSLPSVLLGALLAGPTDEEAYFSALEGYEFLSATMDADVCYVNFPDAFAKAAEENPDSAVLLLYSIVNTLCAQESITSVHLLVDGEVVDSFAGIPTGAPLEANPALVVSNLRY